MLLYPSFETLEKTALVFLDLLGRKLYPLDCPLSHSWLTSGFPGDTKRSDVGILFSFLFPDTK